jgi:hypothetical protein
MDALPDAGSVFYTRTVVTANGFTSDPTVPVGQTPMVLKFDDGSLMGNPYVADGSVVSGVNYRGNRVIPIADMTVSGIRFSGTAGALFGPSSDIGIYQNGVSVTNANIDRAVATENLAHRFDPILLAAGVAYDVVLRPDVGNSTGLVYNMGGGTIPADVKDCKFEGTTLVSGAAVGSLTEDDEAIINFVVVIDGFESGGGGGSASVLGQNGLSGGMQ